MHIGSIPGVGALVLGNPLHQDNRGSVNVPFMREELHDYFMRHNIPLTVTLDKGIAQQTISKSNKNTVRGLHFSPYAKLIVCLQGSIVDVVANATRTPSGGHSVCADSIALHAEYPSAIFVPPGIGHGFISTTDSIVSYLSWGSWSNEAEVNVSMMTPELQWSVGDYVPNMLQMSNKDRESPTFSALSDDDWERIAEYRKVND